VGEAARLGLVADRDGRAQPDHRVGHRRMEELDELGRELAVMPSRTLPSRAVSTASSATARS
jgi:hypothetical protein